MLLFLFAILTFFLRISTFFISCLKKSPLNVDGRNGLEKLLLVEKRLFEQCLNFILKNFENRLTRKESYGGCVITNSQFKRRDIHQKIIRYANSQFNIIFSGNENIGVKWCTKLN